MIAPATRPTTDRANPSDSVVCEADRNGRMSCGSVAGAVARRTIRLPLVTPDDDTWKTLRAVACMAARWGNRLLLGQYLQQVAGLKREERTAWGARLYASNRDELGSGVRDAMRTRADAIWKRSGEAILSGRERGAYFGSRVALAIRADKSKPSARLVRDGDRYILRCRILPADKGEPLDLTVNQDSGNSRKDLWLRSAMDDLWSGAWEPGVVTLRFNLRKHKLDALVSYSRPASTVPAGERTATLGPYDRDQLWLRIDGGDAVSLTDQVARIQYMRGHFEDIRKRLSRGIGHGPGRAKAYRRALARRRSFSEWAEGPVHQLSAFVVSTCEEHGVGRLMVGDLGTGDWPAAQFRQQVHYKCADRGIVVIDDEPDATTESGCRAKGSVVRKRAKLVKRAKDGLAAAGELLSTHRSQTGAETME